MMIGQVVRATGQVVARYGEIINKSTQTIQVSCHIYTNMHTPHREGHLKRKTKGGEGGKDENSTR